LTGWRKSVASLPSFRRQSLDVLYDTGLVALNGLGRQVSPNTKLGSHWRNKLDWSSLVAQIAPFIVRIRTKGGYGTGFVYWQNTSKCCIATAKHVVADADEPGWEQPIHIYQANNNPIICYPDFRESYHSIDESGDSAAIIIDKSGLIFPEKCLPLWDWSKPIPIGTPIGWLGYPQIVGPSHHWPSFFSGVISNALSPSIFGIDGVAIRGVSGGPVFFCDNDGFARVIGTISSYFASKIYTEDGVETWPGLAFAHSFFAFTAITDRLRELENE